MIRDRCSLLLWAWHSSVFGVGFLSGTTSLPIPITRNPSLWVQGEHNKAGRSGIPCTRWVSAVVPPLWMPEFALWWRTELETICLVNCRGPREPWYEEKLWMPIASAGVTLVTVQASVTARCFRSAKSEVRWNAIVSASRHEKDHCCWNPVRRFGRVKQCSNPARRDQTPFQTAASRWPLTMTVMMYRTRELTNLARCHLTWQTVCVLLWPCLRRCPMYQWPKIPIFLVMCRLYPDSHVPVTPCLWRVCRERPKLVLDSRLGQSCEASSYPLTVASLWPCLRGCLMYDPHWYWTQDWTTPERRAIKSYYRQRE